MIIFRIFFDISGFPPLWGNNVTVFTHNLLNKGPIVNELLRFHDILVANIKFRNKLFNLFIFLIFLEIEYRIRSILKYLIDVAEVLGIKVPLTLKPLSVYKYFSTSLCKILSRMII